MPELPVELFLEAVDALVDTDRAWVPTAEGQSLYLRPFMIATEAQVGMRPAHEYLFLLIAFPAAPFFPGEVKPVTVWLSTSTSARPPAAPARPSAPATTPAACSPSARPPSRAATRSSGSTRSSAAGSRRWAA